MRSRYCMDNTIAVFAYTHIQKGRKTERQTDRTEQNRTKQNRTEQNRTEQNRMDRQSTCAADLASVRRGPPPFGPAQTVTHGRQPWYAYPKILAAAFRIHGYEYAHMLIVVTFLVVNIFRFFGHNSVPFSPFWTKFGGFFSYRPPGPF